MHIPDNYLSVSTCALLTVATAPVWIHSIKKVAHEFPKERFSALGVASAFTFLAMMFNVPMPGGTTGHAVGGTVLAVLLGPEAACVSLTCALAIQAFFFGDGGILAFGANCFNMAFLLPFAGFYTFLVLRKLFKRFTPKEPVKSVSFCDCLALGIAAFIGLNVAAFAAAVEFGVQPLLFKDDLGQALYCPYGLEVSIPAMMLGHVTIFGLAEVIFSVFVYAFICKSSPNFVTNKAAFALTSDKQRCENDEREDEENKQSNSRFAPLYILLALLIALTPLGLLAQGTAWGEWGTDEITDSEVTGQALDYTPAAMTDGFQWNALVPDYSFAGLPEWFAYVLSALAGVAGSIVLFKLASTFVKDETTV